MNIPHNYGLPLTTPFHVNPFPNDKFKTLPNWLLITILTLMKMAESSVHGKKTLREKGKLLVMSNFFFSESFSKRLVLQTCKKVLRYPKEIGCKKHCAVYFI